MLPSDSNFMDLDFFIDLFGFEHGLRFVALSKLVDLIVSVNI